MRQRTLQKATVSRSESGAAGYSQLQCGILYVPIIKAFDKAIDDIKAKEG
jgi:hypothetical protein